jgi:hypothetical protein
MLATCVCHNCIFMVGSSEQKSLGVLLQNTGDGEQSLYSKYFTFTTLIDRFTSSMHAYTRLSAILRRKFQNREANL